MPEAVTNELIYEVLKNLQDCPQNRRIELSSGFSTFLKEIGCTGDLRVSRRIRIS